MRNVNEAIYVAHNGKHNYELPNQIYVHIVSVTDDEVMRKVNQQNKNFLPCALHTSPKT